jgi:fructoselysine-6-P-deglycase FrlB-like protein
MTAEPAFDPNAQLPGMPRPWAYGPRPSWREGPPYHMTEMIEAEPALSERLLSRLAESPATTEMAAAIRAAVDERAPVVLTGCGTSETGAMAAVEILRDALAEAGRPDAIVVSEQAFELSLRPPMRGVVIGVTHEGGTGATNAAVKAAAAAGARTGAITASAGSPAGQIAEVVVATEELDQSWCHTIGYLSPVLAAAAIAGKLTDSVVDSASIRSLLGAGIRQAPAAETIAAHLATSTQLLAVASGADRPAAREFTLKLEEATWLPAAYRDLETLLHGHLPATDSNTGLVLFLVERRGWDQRLARAKEALAGAATIGIRAAAILVQDADGDVDPELTPAGRMLVPGSDELSPAGAALFATATAFQTLTERLARARGTNPDLIRREDETYQRAAKVSGG